MNDTRSLILDVALEVLGQNPDAGIGDIASAAGVVHRIVYGRFPIRTSPVRGASLHTMAGLGHFPPFEASVPFNSLLRHFLT